MIPAFSFSETAQRGHAGKVEQHDRQQEGRQADQHYLAYETAAYRRIGTAEHLAGVHSLDAHRRQRGAEVGEVDSGDQQYDERDGDQRVQGAPAGLRQTVEHACRAEVELWKRVEDQLELAVVPVCGVEQVFGVVLLEVLEYSVRGCGVVELQEAVVVPVAPVVVVLLRVHRGVDHVLHGGVLREVPVDSGDRPVDVVLAGGGEYVADSGFAAEDSRGKAFGDDDRARGLQGVHAAFSHVEAEHLGDFG